MRRSEPDYQVSAGGVLVRHSPKGPEVCLIRPRGSPPGRWQLPKGHLDPGEVPEQTALREVLEETGCQAELQEELGAIEYQFWHREGDRRLRIYKRVIFFRMRFLEGDLSNVDAEEIERASFFPLEVAMNRATFKAERNIIRKAAQLLGYVD